VHIALASHGGSMSLKFSYFTAIHLSFMAHTVPELVAWRTWPLPYWPMALQYTWAVVWNMYNEVDFSAVREAYRFD